MLFVDAFIIHPTILHEHYNGSSSMLRRCITIKARLTLSTCTWVTMGTFFTRISIITSIWNATWSKWILVITTIDALEDYKLKVMRYIVFHPGSFRKEGKFVLWKASYVLPSPHLIYKRSIIITLSSFSRCMCNKWSSPLFNRFNFSFDDQRKSFGI